MPELTEAIHSEIQRLSAEGDALANERKYSEAIPVYLQAWDLLPEPKPNGELLLGCSRLLVMPISSAETTRQARTT